MARKSAATAESEDQPAPTQSEPGEQRSNYVLALEVTTLSPLSHGAGTDGNASIARTTEVIIEEVDPDTLQRYARSVRVPIVSGSSFRATLREHAFGHFVETVGIADGSVSLDALRLLLKGGKNDAGGATVSLSDARRLRDLFPMLAVFGSMDGGLPMRGSLRVSQLVPWAEELVVAGIVPRTVSGIEVSVQGREGSVRAGGGGSIPLFADRAPIPLHMLLTEEEYFRHDLRTSPHVRLLDGPVRNEIEDKSAARKGHAAGKDERRDANESMPHTTEAIKAGVPMVAVLRLLGASPIEFECVCYALTRWIAHGALLGGAVGKGHGRCAVRIAGALCYSPEPGSLAAQPGTALTLDRLGDGYLRHIGERADAIRSELAAVRRGAGAEPKGGKGGKGKVSALPDESESGEES